MAEGLSAAGANTALDALVAAYPHVQLHIGAPGAAGTANPATETTRKQVTWAASSGGSAASAAQVQWTNIAGSQDATHFTAWSAATGGTFGFSGTVTANPYTAGDTVTVAAGALTVSLPLAS